VKTRTTESSKFSNCLIRNKPIANTPEERVRQSLIQKMIKVLGFPKGLISIERGIAQRRFDLVCYSNSMKPLVLIECKAEKIDDAAMRQALGYNDTIKAPFICLASATEVITFWQEKGKMGSVPFLPKYSELYEISKRL